MNIILKTGRHYFWKKKTEKYLQVPNKMQKQVQTGAQIVLKRAINFLTGPRQILTLLCSLRCANTNTYHCSTKITELIFQEFFSECITQLTEIHL